MFGFAQVKRENYGATFLRKVEIVINFEKILNLKEFSEKVVEIFKLEFPRVSLGKSKGFQVSIEGKVKSIEEDDMISLKTEDGQIEMTINCDNIFLSIDGRKYESYDSNIKGILEKIVNFFSLCSIESIKSCNLRKINLIEFGYTEQAPNGILNALLNSAITSKDEAFLGTEFITQNIHNIEFKEEEYVLNIRYGMNTLPFPDKKIGQLIVDNNISSNTEIKSNDVVKEIEKLNNELFNVFSWIFNEDAKKMLKNEHHK